MNKRNFILISNQRSGSTWFITSLGNCGKTTTDYEIKWSKDMLLGEASPYHMFLKNNTFEKIFNTFSNNKKEHICGTKFVFDFYRPLPVKDYNKFINKFTGYKIIHLNRNYLDILKSKLIGKVTHLIDKNNLVKNRMIDKTILKKQKDYENIQNKLRNSKEKIDFTSSKNYILNLFINDLLALSLKKNNRYLNIDYENSQNNMLELSSFLDIPVKVLQENFFRNPTIKKNNLIYSDNFENFSNLKKINLKLRNKLNDLLKINFDINNIILYDNKTNKLNINL
jgi:hypothetical protein